MEIVKRLAQAVYVMGILAFIAMFFATVAAVPDTGAEVRDVDLKVMVFFWVIGAALYGLGWVVRYVLTGNNRCAYGLSIVVCGPIFGLLIGWLIRKLQAKNEKVRYLEKVGAARI